MKILIIGCGRLGAGLAQALSLRSHQVTIIDRDATAFDRLLPSFAGQQLDGAGFDRGLLLRAGIDRADHRPTEVPLERDVEDRFGQLQDRPEEVEEVEAEGQDERHRRGE